MKDFLKPHWTWITGAFTSMGFKGIEDVTKSGIQFPDLIIQHDPFWHYFVIGMLGALGGLLIKVAWSICKKRWPKLKELDK